jgi:hypothetical protein
MVPLLSFAIKWQSILDVPNANIATILQLDTRARIETPFLEDPQEDFDNEIKYETVI